MAKKTDPLDFNFGANRKPRRRVDPRSRTAAQKASYARYFGGKKGKGK